MCAILQLVSAPLNPIPIAEHFYAEHIFDMRIQGELKNSLDLKRS